MPLIKSIQAACAVFKHYPGNTVVKTTGIKLPAIQCLTACTDRSHGQFLFIPGGGKGSFRCGIYPVEVARGVAHGHGKDGCRIPVAAAGNVTSSRYAARFQITDNLTFIVRHLYPPGSLIEIEVIAGVYGKTGTQAGFRNSFLHISRIATCENVIQIGDSAFGGIIDCPHHSAYHLTVGVDEDVVEGHFKRRIPQKRNMNIAGTRKIA